VETEAEVKSDERLLLIWVIPERVCLLHSV